MSTIPSSAMPHAYAHDEDEQTESQEKSGPSTGLLVGGAAVAAYLLYKVLR
jgi:hypothetical protein